VVPPTVAILGAGRIAKQVVVVEDKPAVRRMLPLSLTFDHRVATGGEAGRFLKCRYPPTFTERQIDEIRVGSRRFDSLTSIRHLKSFTVTAPYGTAFLSFHSTIPSLRLYTRS
jgi:hypothetical protein